MKAVVLAGGKGTRLLPYTTIIPKPLMPVGEKSILEVLLRQLEHYGVTDVTISLGHLGHLVQAVLGNGDKFAAKIDYSVEDEPLGTSGPLSLIPDLNDTFLVLNGDILTNIDLHRMIEFHRSNDSVATIATHRRSIDINYGVIHSSDCRLVNYSEKPTLDYEVSMGIYVLEPSVLKYISPSSYLDFPDLVQILMANGESVFTFPFDGIWYDLGRVEDFQRVQAQLEEMKEAIPFL